MTGASCNSRVLLSSDRVAVELPICVADSDFGDADRETASNNIDKNDHDCKHEHVASVLAHKIEGVLDRVDRFAVALRIENVESPEEKKQSDEDVADTAGQNADE